MAPDEEQLRFFVDESLMGLGKALSYARKDTVYTGHQLAVEVPTGTRDEDWIPRIANRGLIAIGRDRKMQTRPGEVSLWLEHGLRGFHIAGKKDLSTWDYISRLVYRWNDIEEAVRLAGPGPWLYYVTDRQVRPVNLSPP